MNIKYSVIFIGLCFIPQGWAGVCDWQEQGAQQLACLEGVVQGIGFYDPSRARHILHTCEGVASRLDCLAKEVVAQREVDGSPEARAKGWRLEVGLGYGHGRHDGTFEVADSPLQLSSFLGGAGSLKRLALFAPASDQGWHWGLEYVGLVNRSRARLWMPNGVAILTDPVQGEARLQAEGDFMFIDLMKGFPLAEGVEPYMGIGLGAGYGRVAADFSLQTAVLSPARQQLRASSWIPALQGLAGVRFAAWQSLYFTLGSRVLYLTGYPFGVEHAYLNLSLEGGVGTTF